MVPPLPLHALSSLPQSQQIPMGNLNRINPLHRLSSSRYLIPCNYMMLSQRRVVKERDFYSASAAKILALTPSCCSPEHSPPPIRQLDSILWTKGSDCLSLHTERKGVGCHRGMSLDFGVCCCHLMRV